MSIFRRFRTARARVFLWTWMTAALCLTLGAQLRAQDDMGSEMEMWTEMMEKMPAEAPTIPAREVHEIAEAFDMDDTQQALIESVHEGYLEEFRAASARRYEKMLEMVKDVSEAEDFMTVGPAMNNLERTWRADRERMNETFMQNVQMLLDEDQLAHWPAYERDRRRRTYLHVGAFFHGEGVDLVSLIDELELEESTRSSLDPTLDAYAMSIDTPLQKRIEMQERIRKASEDMMAGGMDENGMPEFDFATHTQNLKDVVKARSNIRDVNHQYQQILMGSLPVEMGQSFEKQWQRESYPSVYAPTQADTYIDDLLDRDDLTGEQREGLELVRQSHDLNVDAINDQLARIESDVEKTLESILNGKSNDWIIMMIGSFAAADDDTTMQMFDFDLKSVFLDDAQEARRTELLASRVQFIRAALEQAFGMLSGTQQAAAPRPDVPDKPESEELRVQLRDQMKQVMSMMEQIDF